MRALAGIRVGLFLMALVLPLLRTYPKNVPLPNELRSRAPLPSLITARGQYPAQFDAFVRDNFGGRDRFIYWHNLLKFRVFRESPVAAVIVGRSGWFFYAATADGIDVRNFAGRWPHAPSDLDRWIDEEDALQRQYARSGAQYLIVIAPDKQSVYPELVPARFGPPAPGMRSELMHRLEAHPRLPVLDLTPVLNGGRDGEPLFYKADTHWNTRGTFLAAQAITARLRERLPTVGTIRADDYVRSETPRDGGDLMTMLGLGIRVPDRTTIYRRRAGGARLLTEEGYHKIWVQPGSGLPTAVLVGDSFGVDLAPTLADAFSRLHYHLATLGPPDPDLVQRERPDIVVRIMVERYLMKLAEFRQ